MRLSIALGALAGGLVLGSAVMAPAAAPPPAAPIFYCPSAPAAGKNCPRPAAAPPVARVEHRRPEPRHERRYAERRWMAREAPRREDVSASQAFIYRYERALHGLNAEAADAAWAHAGPPPCRGPCPPAEAARPAPPIMAPAPPPAPPEHVLVRPAPPPPVIVEVAPTPPARVIVERIAPPAPPPPVYAPPPTAYAPPPCPDRCPMSFEHDGWRAHHDYAEAAPPPAYGHRPYAETAPPPVYSGRVEHYGYLSQPPPAYGEREGAFIYERRETERSSGWRNDGDGGYAERYQDRRGPCPPSPGYGCSAARAADGPWRDGGDGGVYQYSGRDAYGFLVWPGKSDGQ